MLFGIHVSIAGGVFNAPINAAQDGCETFQIFTRSPRGGNAPELTKEILKQFNENLKQNNITDFVVHAPYYINYASNNPRIAQGSIRIIRQELERSSLLGAKYLMFHMGSAKDFGKEKSLKMVIDGLNETLKNYKGKTELLIENSAGAGEIIGDTFEEIGLILKKLKSKEVGVCLDTCHAFASGYDFRDKKSLDKTLKEFDKHIGLDKLKLLHLNDSRTQISSHKDRHADIGKGLIGKKVFEEIVKHPKLKNINAILETPADEMSYKEQLSLLKKIGKAQVTSN